MFAAHAALDGYEKQTDEKVIRISYDISPRTRIDIALNMNTLREQKQAYETARNGIVSKLSGGTGIIEPYIKDANDKPHVNPKHIAFEKEHKELLDSVVELKLHQLSAKSLHIGYNDDPLAKENNIASGIILELLPILVDLPEEKVIKKAAA
jgi:hypothetical protein